MMEQMLELFFKHGLRPMTLMAEAAELEQALNRSEISALMFLEYRGELTMSELAAELGAPLSTVTSLTKRLVRKGLAERNQSDKDQRIILVRLSDEGRKLAGQAKAMMENMFARVQAALSPEELQQFLTLAVKVGKALQHKEDKDSMSSDRTVRKIRIDD